MKLKIRKRTIRYPFAGLLIACLLLAACSLANEPAPSSVVAVLPSEGATVTSPRTITQVQKVEPGEPAEGDGNSAEALPVELDRVYGKWHTEGHQFFPHFDTWEFREDGTLHLSSEDSSNDATGVFFFNCDFSDLTDEQLATVPHYYAKGTEGGAVVFSDICQEWIENPDQSRGYLEGEQFFSFAYQVNPPDFDSSSDGSHPVMIISFPDSDDRMEVHIAGIGNEIIMFVYEEPMVFERIE